MPRTPRHNPSASSECPSALELASWSDGTLDLERAGAIAMHVIDCVACGAAVRGIGSDLEAAMIAEIAVDDLDPSQVSRVIARAGDLVEAPAPLSYSAESVRRAASSVPSHLRGGTWRTTFAAAASLVAALAGWQAASYMVGNSTSRESAATVAASDSAIVASTAIDSSNGTSVSATTSTESSDDDSDELSQLLTFGLFDALVGDESADSNARSDS